MIANQAAFQAALGAAAGPAAESGGRVNRLERQIRRRVNCADGHCQVRGRMSTKGTHIPDWLKVPFAGITPAPSQEKGQDLFPTGNWRAIRPVYRDKMPPCNNACGTNEKIQGYLDLVKRGKYLDAYALIKEDMPFPSVTGRVCYHPCEQACNRGQYDEAISIRAVERFLGDLGLALPRDVVKAGSAERQEGRGRRLGSGRTQRRVSARAPRLRGHDSREVAEGRRSEPRRHSRLGAAAGRARPRDRAARRARRSRSRRTPRSARTSRWDDLKRDYDACVLAVGLTEPNSVRAEGEDKDGVLYGLPFLRDIGMGTSTVKLGPRVAVIGGGNTAIDCAREAFRQGALEVTMITVEANTEGDAVRARGSARHARGRRRAAARPGDDRRRSATARVEALRAAARPASAARSTPRRSTSTARRRPSASRSTT